MKYLSSRTHNEKARLGFHKETTPLEVLSYLRGKLEHSIIECLKGNEKMKRNIQFAKKIKQVKINKVTLPEKNKAMKKTLFISVENSKTTPINRNRFTDLFPTWERLIYSFIHKKRLKIVWTPISNL